MSTTPPPPPIPPKSPLRRKPSQIYQPSQPSHLSPTTPNMSTNPKPTHQSNRNSTPSPLRPRPISPVRNHSSSPIPKSSRLTDQFRKPSMARKKSRDVLRSAFGSLRFGRKGKVDWKKVVSREGSTSVGGGEPAVDLPKDDGENLRTASVGNSGGNNGEGPSKNVSGNSQTAGIPHSRQTQHPDSASATPPSSQHLKPNQNIFKDFLKTSRARGVDAEKSKNVNPAASTPKDAEFAIIVRFTLQTPSRPVSSVSSVSLYQQVYDKLASPHVSQLSIRKSPVLHDALILVSAHTTFDELIEKIHEVYNEKLFGVDVKAAAGVDLEMMGIEEIRFWCGIVGGKVRSLKVYGEKEMERVWRFMEMDGWRRWDWIEIGLVKMELEVKGKGKARQERESEIDRKWQMEQEKERLRFSRLAKGEEEEGEVFGGLSDHGDQQNAKNDQERRGKEAEQSGGNIVQDWINLLEKQKLEWDAET